MTKNLIQSKITELVQSYIEQGYLISESYQTNSFPNISLVNRKDKVSIASEITYEAWQVSTVKVIVTKNKKIVQSYVYYQFEGLTSTSREEIDKARATRTSRYRNLVEKKQIINLNTVGLKMLRNKKGWKTVPAKNIQVTRLSSELYHSGYLVKNITNNHQFVKYF